MEIISYIYYVLKMRDMSKIKMTKEEISNEQLKNLFLALQMNTSIKGVDRLIGIAIRDITNYYQEYTVTKKLRDLYESVGINVPVVVNHYKLKRYTGKAMKLLPNEPRVNNSIAMTEHIMEIGALKDSLVSKVPMLKEMDEVDAIEYIREYLNTNVKMFHKLSYHEANLETRNGMTWDELESQLVDVDSVSIKL